MIASNMPQWNRKSHGVSAQPVVSPSDKLMQGIIYFSNTIYEGNKCIPTDTNNHWLGTLVSTIFCVIFSSKHGYLVLRCMNIHLLKKQQLVSYQA